MLKHYRILDIKPGVSEVELKKAYRKQALRYHPDRNSSAQATVKFQEITDAYHALLSNSKKSVTAYSAEEIADALAKRLEDQKREKMKAYVRKMREREQEELINSTYYKVFRYIERSIAYVTLILAATMILIPVITFLFEFDTPEFNWKRGLDFIMIIVFGSMFVYGGVYLVKRKSQ